MVSPYQITQQIDTECSNMAQVGHVEQILRQETLLDLPPGIVTKGLGLFVSHGTSLEIVPLQRASGLLSVYGVVVSSAQHHGQQRCGTQPKFLTNPETHGPVLVGRPPDQQSRNEVSFEVSQKTVLQEKHLCSLQPIAYGIHPGPGFSSRIPSMESLVLFTNTRRCNNNNGPDCLVQLLAGAPKSTASLVLCVGQFPHRYVTSSV